MDRPLSGCDRFHGDQGRFCFKTVDLGQVELAVILLFDRFVRVTILINKIGVVVCYSV